MMDPVKFTCRCQNASSKWLEMAPTDMHNYRVECGSCGKFIKWGAESELEGRVKAHDAVSSVGVFIWWPRVMPYIVSRITVGLKV